MLTSVKSMYNIYFSHVCVGRITFHAFLQSIVSVASD